MKRKASLSFQFILLLLLLTACGEKIPREEQIRQYVETGKIAAEARDVIAIRNLISEKYKDASNRDRRALTRLTTGYFLRHKNIHLFTQINEITFPVKGQARVSLFVAMAGTPVTGAQALIDLRADLYRFDLTLSGEGEEWQLLNASWQRARIDDLLGAG